MKNNVVESYENYREEDRLTTNNGRKIEFLTTVRAFDRLIPPHSKILDCAAGAGVYAFYLADRGHKVTATDLTPRHIRIIEEKSREKDYFIDARVCDARDLSRFADDSFDAVLNMGPFYHLLTRRDRQKCLSECLRVLKKGGLLFTAYIPRFFVFQYVALKNQDYLDRGLARQIFETGVMRREDEKSFWTDTYYSTRREMEEIYHKNGLEIIDHFAQDGITPFFSQTVDKWSNEQFKIWCDCHYRVSREKSLLGASNHVIIAGRK